MVTLFDVSYSVFKDAASFSTVYYYINPKQDGYILGTGNQSVVYYTRITESIDISDFAINIEPNAILVNKEGDALASPTIFQTGQLQIRYDIQESNTNFIYIGKARLNVPTNVAGWTITRFTLNNDGVSTQKNITAQDTAIWDNRALEVYN